ncbi:MAG: hypothetical protein U1D97_06225 [Desulfuromonadales bacterium]|nr:hypothetical protein [Desulfuromonadales bacterium]
MGIFSGLFGAKPKVDRRSFVALVPRLTSELQLIREQFLFGGVTGLRSEGAHVVGISTLLEQGSELDAALKGFQLTNIVGFAWNYIEFPDHLPFDKQLTESMESRDGDFTKQYRERYLDCEGNVEALTSALAEDIHRIWGRPAPVTKFKRALENTAMTLGVVSQATTANIFGDLKTEKQLKGRLLF